MRYCFVRIFLIFHILISSLLLPHTLNAEAIINGRPESSIERQKFIDLQKQTIEELRSSNFLLREEAEQRLTIIKKF